ncbi:MAG: hypothetical protein JWQ42_4721 [Edaphobacter sp.]|nr:hypothetical protein [Edaphobacter sp.]
MLKIKNLMRGSNKGAKNGSKGVLGAFRGDGGLQNQKITWSSKSGMEEAIGSIPIRSTNKPYQYQ